MSNVHIDPLYLHFPFNDGEVYSFIHSEDCNSFDDLFNYLVSERLPLRFSWTYYYFGLMKSKDELDSFRIASKKGKMNPLVQAIVLTLAFEKYLENEKGKKLSIIGELVSIDERPYCDTVHQQYIQAGYEYAKNAVDTMTHQHRLFEFPIISETEHKIFDFIENDNNGRSSDALIIYLKRENLPLTYRWFAYQDGITGICDPEYWDDEEIEFSYEPWDNSSLRASVSYMDYLNTHDINSDDVQAYLSENDIESKVYHITEEIINQGYEYVIKQEEEFQRIEKMLSHYERYGVPGQSYDSEYSTESKGCDACQQNPCMCSDKGKTSTVYDF